MHCMHRYMDIKSIVEMDRIPRVFHQGKEKKTGFITQNVLELFVKGGMLSYNDWFKLFTSLKLNLRLFIFPLALWLYFAISWPIVLNTSRLW